MLEFHLNILTLYANIKEYSLLANLEIFYFVLNFLFQLDVWPFYLCLMVNYVKLNCFLFKVKKHFDWISLFSIKKIHYFYLYHYFKHKHGDQKDPLFTFYYTFVENVGVKILQTCFFVLFGRNSCRRIFNNNY